MMARTWLLLLLPALMGQSPASKDDSASQQAARIKRERLLEIYTKDAAGYTIYRDASRKEKVELRREPVYVWTNPVREGGQDGAVFVWTCRGRAEVLGTIFSFPASGPRKLVPRVSFAVTVGARRDAPGRMHGPGRPRPRASSWHRSRARRVPPAPAPQRLSQMRR